ncbi:hypothetical protein HYX12_04130 [Candidatus Woesearchaeota archaeon]|nr:hypothetical protein [Candidatus Woesearchaeota archaeon]
METDQDIEQITKEGNPTAKETRVEVLIEQLRRTSLEDIMRNVRAANSDLDKCQAKEVEQSVERVYRGYTGTISQELPIKEASRISHRDSMTIYNWRKKRTFPTELSAYMDSYFPQTREQRRAFAYLLGVLSHSHKGSEKVFSKTPKDSVVKKRIKRAIGAIAPGKVIQEREKSIEVVGKLFRATLEHALTEYEQYVRSKEESKAYLQGYFDMSSLKLDQLNNGVVRYGFDMIGNVRNLQVILRSCLRIDLYPTFNVNQASVIFSGQHNLGKVRSYGFDRSKENNRRVDAYLKQGKERKEISLQGYYELRDEVQECYDYGERPMWTKLSERYGFGYATLQKWCGDLIEQHEGRPFMLRTPRIVQNYEQALEELGLPNPFKNKKVEYEDFRLIVDGKPFILTAAAQRNYFKTFASEEEPLDASHRDHIRKNLALQLHDIQNDMYFTIKGNKITEISTREIELASSLIA